MTLAAALLAAGAADQPAEAPVAQPAPVVAVAPPAPAPMVLPKGTLVRLMLTREINSRDNKAGQRFALRVDEAVVVDGVTIVPVGGKAWAEVVSADGTGAAGKNGRLNARLLYLEAEGGRQLPLEGERAAKGGSSTGAVVAGLLAFGIPGLLMKGNNATLRAGEIFNGYTTADASFDRSAAIAPAPGPATTTTTTTAKATAQ